MSSSHPSDSRQYPTRDNRVPIPAPPAQRRRQKTDLTQSRLEMQQMDGVRQQLPENITCAQTHQQSDAHRQPGCRYYNDNQQYCAQYTDDDQKHGDQNSDEEFPDIKT